ncbi:MULTISPECIES: TRAP transporter small permease subunit [Halocynthiibacter]|uniref:TRAP transporter small permease protein n=1 Tax=Halocynthiibacter halioticoli TaxID=2986804 RepID=A0AAE3IY78_9RHOB|nr:MULTISPECIES: TRAP transporter small permease subunit [Halocynthiibacter]MCV6824199.1 TRAP transporter small permease subunit [Halocynthiibacter halioticoli]MCW4057200.1 TRAP transporter small permease subunit [Halocynthiibacter sp. SDUM655004]MDE0589771.1 TRAP transporter small permease subunit [Halocynthiibacter sp. C4]
MLDGIIWFFKNILLGFYNFGYAVTHPHLWLNWSDKAALMNFIYYGGSVEFFFVVLDAFLVLTVIGLWRNSFMWGCVRLFEGIGNWVGRIFAWAGLAMVLQQIIIVFVQRIFTQAQISFGFGPALTKDISWWSEELKFYNALVVALCVSYTFVQGGHVRVDLVYSAVKFRTQRAIDMFGSIFFMMPMAVLIWMYAWFFMWRHLVTPKISATDKLELLEKKARILKWNVETIGFSPNGFNGYFLFKILLLLFTALVFIQAVAFFYRSYLERKEGPASEGKFLDRDTLGEGEEAYEGTH